jgi:antitoxin (DNA-binding transcriptional repressor) of toxin-antitoxin stability system
MVMQVKISELKDRLSHYLRLVREGQTVLICDRDRVIARLEPAGGAAGAAAVPDARWLDDLERRGAVRRGTGKLGRGWLPQRPKLAADAVASLLREREEEGR